MSWISALKDYVLYNITLINFEALNIEEFASFNSYFHASIFMPNVKIYTQEKHNLYFLCGGASVEDATTNCNLIDYIYEI